MTDTTTLPPVRRKSRARWLIAPGVIWMALFLIAPIAMIVYVSFWTQTTFAISPVLTLASWKMFFASDTYIASLFTKIGRASCRERV